MYKAKMLIPPIIVLLLGIAIIGEGIWSIIRFSVPVGVFSILVGVFMALGGYGGLLRYRLLNKQDRDSGENPLQNEK